MPTLDEITASAMMLADVIARREAAVEFGVLKRAAQHPTFHEGNTVSQYIGPEIELTRQPGGSYA